MFKLRNTVFSFLLAAMIMFCGINVQAAPVITTDAKQAILVDYDTGMVLFEKNAREQMPTSSMSKVITAYAVFDALKDERLTLDGELRVSEKAWRKGGSKMFVEVNDLVTVDDLLKGVIVQSGNDATIVLAEGIAGTEEAFADVLNMIAEKLGMKNSHFMNASGWPDPEHYSTAYDLSLLARALIQNHPEYYDYYAIREFTYNNIKQRNRNPLIYRNIGADGIKTGHTEVGGYGLMASGVRDGRRVLLVVNGLADEKARAQEGGRLLEWGLKAFENVTLFTAGETVAEATVTFGKEESVPLVLEKPLIVTMPFALRNDLDVNVVYRGPLKAPIKAGQEIGYVEVKVPRGETLQVPLKAGVDVDGLGFVSGTLSKIKYMFGGKKSGDEDQK